MEAGTFRKDLYYRINIFPIFIPPLRDRTDDIIPLANYYLKKYAEEYKRPVSRISTPAMDLLTGYKWPGNIRELRNTMERAVLVCDEEAIRAYHLPTDMQKSGQANTLREHGAGFTETVERLEKDLIVDALRNAQGNIHQSARDIPHHLLQNQKVRHQLPRLPSLPFQRRQEGIREPAGGSSEQGSLFLYVCCLPLCLLKLPDISAPLPVSAVSSVSACLMGPCPSGRSSARTFPSYGLLRYPAVAFSCQAGFKAFTTERAPPGHSRSGETKMFLCFFRTAFSPERFCI